METDTEGVCRCKLSVQNPRVVALGEYVVVVQTGGTAVFQKFAHTCKRTVVRYVLIYIFPYFV